MRYLAIPFVVLVLPLAIVAVGALALLYASVVLTHESCRLILRGYK